MKKLLLLLIPILISCERVELQDPLQEWEVETIQIDHKVAQKILDKINIHRASINLTPLIMESGLTAHLAAQHCNYMIHQGRISHDNFADRARILSNYGAEAVGENVAFGYTSAHEVVNAWLLSSTHKDVLEGNYTHIGVGATPDEYGDLYFCAILIRNN